MKILKNSFLILFLFPILFLQDNSFAAQPAGVFLELPISARAGGMADCYTALADDPFGVYYNPAGISFIKQPTASFLHQQYLQDTNGSFAGITIPGKNFSINIAPGLIAMKEEPIYDSLGDDTGKTFKFQGTIIPVSGAYRLGNLSLGVTAKYYKEEIADEVKNVTTYDAGVIYKFKNISLGASWLNMSGKLWDYDLPKTIKYGIACTTRRINLLFDYNSQIMMKKGSYNIGGELLVTDYLFVRLGYKLKDEFGGLSYGLGIKMGKFDIDYASSSYSELGMAQRASLSYRFSTEKATVSAKNKEVPIQSVKKLARGINIAVCKFAAKNTSAVSASVVTDSIRAELVSRKKFNILEKANMEKMLVKQEFQMSGCTSRECAVKMGKILNAKVVLIGSLSKTWDTYYITVSLVDVETGEILQSIAQNATWPGLSKACKQIVKKIE